MRFGNIKLTLKMSWDKKENLWHLLRLQWPKFGTQELSFLFTPGNLRPLWAN